MQRHGFRRLLCASQIGFEPLPFGLEFDERVADILFLGKALHIGLVYAVKLAIGGCQARFDARTIGDQPGCKPLALFVIGLDIGRDEIGRGQIGLQSVEDRALDRIQIIGATMIAGARLLHLRALDALPPFPCVLDGHAGAAAAAFQQAGKNALGLPCVAGNRTAPLPLDTGCLLEELLTDDPEMRRVDRLPFGLRVRARNALPGIRVLDHADLVPNDSARIKIVQDDAVMALQGAVQGRRRPVASAGRWNLPGVQSGCNLARRLTGDIGVEYFTDDRGFVLGDLQLAGLERHRPVSIGPPAGMTPVANDARHSAPDLVGEVLEIERADKAANTDLNLVRLAVMDGPELDPEKVDSLPKAGKVFLIAREAIQRLDKNDLESALPRRIHHAHQAVAAKHGGAGARPVIEDGRHFETVFRGVAAA